MMELLNLLNGYANKILASAGILVVSWVVIWGYSLHMSNKRHKEIILKIEKILEKI